MKSVMNRRDFIKSAAIAAVATAIPVTELFTGSGAEAAYGTGQGGFYFVQCSDTHWGFDNPKINPNFATTLKKAVGEINALPQKIDFIVFTGDNTHTTDDDAVRRQRMTEFKSIVKGLKCPTVKFLPGEHDAALDNGAIYKENFGATHYTFDHKGVHFIALDNVSDPHAQVGQEQLNWLAADLKKLNHNARIVILTHRPLFDLAPDWDWATVDGAQVLALLKPFKHVEVLYGHIHQLNHHVSGEVTLDAATGMMYPLPAPHSVPKKAPIPWDPANPYHNLGFRILHVSTSAIALTQHPLVASGAAKTADPPRTISITAKRFEYSPNEITLKKGQPVVLELKSLDRIHGFNCHGLGLRTDIVPNQVTKLSFTPTKTGKFEFHCDVYCGSGHEGMNGMFTVVE